jgi:hypothetical protein
LSKADSNTPQQFTLFGEEWALVKVGSDGIEAAKDGIGPIVGAGGDWTQLDGWVCQAVIRPAGLEAPGVPGVPRVPGVPAAVAVSGDALEGLEGLEGEGSFRQHLPIGLQDGLVMVWPGTCKPESFLPTAFEPPKDYTIHAELIIDDVPVEHGLLMENLLDLAHAPFTHTGTFAKGWGVPNFVEFVTSRLRKPGDGWHDMASSLAASSSLGSQQGSWNPYPIDMKFVTPCMVDSHIGMSQAGAAGGGAQLEDGVQCEECSNHLHQLHVCLPSVAGELYTTITLNTKP